MRTSFVRFSACASTAFAVIAVSLSVAQEASLEPVLPDTASQANGASPSALPSSAGTQDSTTEEKRLVSIGEALAASNKELAALRDQHEQLKLQMEALGVAAIKGDERSLQQRLLKSVSDLRSTEKDRKELSERTTRLAEAAAAFIAKPSEPTLKVGLEEAIKNAALARKPTESQAASLEAARVVTYKAELGLAVINAGRLTGVRMGTPFRIMRADRSVATGLVVDVRDRISGLLITGDGIGAVRAGDAVKPELSQSTPKQ
jgi:hypothetical protein